MKPLLIALALLVGCGPSSSFGPTFKAEGMVRMDPVPPEYAGWYAETLDCFNQDGGQYKNRFEDVVWWVADEVATGGNLVGAVQNGDWIVIMRDLMLWRRIVRHESGHHIVGRTRDIHFDDSNRAICDGGPEPLAP